MGKRFVITESEIQQIKSMYGLLNEDSKVITASSTPERMYNFGPNGNSQHGLKGDKTKEKYYFSTKLGNLITLSTGDSANYLSSFVPTTPHKEEYIDYLKIGDTELKNSGTISFNLESLPSTTEVIATHNGLLVIRRMMDQIDGIKSGKVSLSMSAEKRASEQSEYKLGEIPSKLRTNFNTLETYLAVLIVPGQYIKDIGSNYAKTTIVPRGNDGIKSAIQNILKDSLVGVFLAKEDKPDIEKIIADKGLVTTVNLSEFEKYYGSGPTSDLNKSWVNLQNQIKKIMISNFKLYQPEEDSNKLNELIKNTYSTSYFQDEYRNLFKTSTMAPASPTKQATKTQSSKEYELGK